MTDQRSGWRPVKFGELAECINDRVDDPSKAGVDRYVGLDHLDPESLCIRRWGTPDEVESTKLRFKPGDIIFGKRRAYQRKLAVADFEGICSAHAMVLRAKPKAVLPEFLPFFMRSDAFMERAVAISVGSLSPTINWRTLAAEEFRLPPLEEQARLLTRLRLVRRQSELVNELRDALTEQRDALCHWWATARGAPLAADGTVPTEALPAGWQLLTLAALCPERNSLVIGPFGSDLVADDYQHASGVPVVFVADVVRHRFAYTSNRFVTEEKSAALAAHHAVPGDVLITKMGWPPGEACVVPQDFERGVVTADVVRARPDRKLVIAEYLAAVLNSHWGQQQIVRVSPGTTRPKTTLRDMASIAVAIPPVPQQGALVEALAGLRAQIEESERYARQSDRLQAAIAQTAWGSNVH
jgi:restriction endonuclease S subunit